MITIKQAIQAVKKFKDLQNKNKQLQVLSLISVLYFKDDFYKRILYDNERIDPGESEAFQSYIQRKKMQRSVAQHFIVGYLIYPLILHKRSWFLLTFQPITFVCRALFASFLYYKQIYDKFTQQMRFIQKNLQVIKSSVFERIHEIPDLPPERSKSFVEYINKMQQISKEIGKSKSKINEILIEASQKETRI